MKAQKKDVIKDINQNNAIDPFANAGVSNVSTPQRQKTSNLPTSPTIVDPGNDEIVVTVETLQDALGSKIWKFRKAAYELLGKLIDQQVTGGEPSNDLKSDEVFQSLDDLVPAMMKESNAGALDAALRFALLYADHCTGASETDQAKAISEALTSGPALASSRPSTTKLVKSLYLKLMEVGREGFTSIHAVVESLLSLGLTSKKPKVVIKSLQLVLDGSNAFGAASLPLGKISSSAPQMLKHANGSVREAGIQILAEICRAIGSKEPLEDVISNMKPSQVSELDALLSKQPHAIQPTMRLRHQKNTSSAVDALAVLQSGAAEASAEAYESRPAVNLLKELKGTEYNSKMKEPKWSQKTAALDILLSCGGKKPFKLEQPSGSINYNVLVSDLKRLLEHTHFAVRTKSLNALAMLAEGVGEKMFPNLRPLLLQIIGLSKDKKLTSPTQNCLNALFGNIIGFVHLLEKEDGLPAVMSEKVQKNAIVRKTALAFLGECIERSEEAGPRGKLDPEVSNEIAKLCVLKTKDSDASVRKEAISVLLYLPSAAISCFVKLLVS